MNPLATIPARYRATVYGLYALAGLVLGGIQVGYLATPGGQPSWLTIAFAVYGFIGTATGATALTHTTPAK